MQQPPESTPRRLLASNRGRVCLWLIFIGLLGVTAAVRLPDGIIFRSDMLALLPEVERQPRVAEASAKFSKGFEQQLVFAVDFGNGAALNVQVLSQYASELETRLSASALFLSTGNPDEPGPGLADRSPPNAAGSGEQNSWRGAKFQLLTPTMRQTIQSKPQAMLDATRRTLYGLMASAQPIDLEHDPLNLHGQYQASFIPPSMELLTPTTILTNTAGKPVLILPRRLSAGAFDLGSHDKLLALIDELKAWGNDHGAQVLASGLPVFAAHGARGAQFEISTFGSISLIGVIFILLFTFRSVWPLLGTLSCIGVGVASAMVATQAIFGEIHLLTMVFGASLIGISVDYALHYLCDGLGKVDWTPIQGLRSVITGISIALITSVAAFLSFLMTPFPGLQQIAVFSATGLAAAWLTVVAILPIIGSSSGSSTQPSALRYMDSWNKHWPFLNPRALTALGVILGALIVAGLIRLEPNDNVQILQSSPAKLLAEDAAVRRLSPIKQASQFYVVSAASEADLLITERRLVNTLQKSPHHQGQVTAISNRYPGLDQQKQDYELIREQYYKNGRLSSFLQGLGLAESSIENNNSAFNQAFKPLSINAWLADAPGRLSTMWLGCDAIGCRSVVLLQQVLDKPALAALAEHDPNIHWVDQVGAISALLRDYRLQATSALSVVYGLAAALLIFRFGLSSGLRVIAVPIAATIVTLAITGLVGNIFSLFSLLALMVVAGISIDYAVFYRLHGANRPTTSLAIALSAMTTMLAFGLLSLSGTAVVHTFGLTLLVGILTAFFISPFAAGPSQETHN